MILRVFVNQDELLDHGEAPEGEVWVPMHMALYGLRVSEIRYSLRALRIIEDATRVLSWKAHAECRVDPGMPSGRQSVSKTDEGGSTPSVPACATFAWVAENCRQCVLPAGHEEDHEWVESFRERLNDQS